ncbi:MAG: hypothetical protein AAF657_34665 [Acidobacteriota bacterium]
MLSYRRSIARLSLSAGLALAPIAVAGTLEVRAHYRDGRPVAEQDLVLIPHSAVRQTRLPTILPPFTEVETTDRDGRAVFEDLSPGIYSVDVFGVPKDPLLVKASHNPMARSPLARLDEAADRRRIDLELWQGIPMTIEAVRQTGASAVGWRFVLRHPDSGFEIDRSAFAKSRIEWVVAPGSWEASLVPHPGFAAVAVERDGVRLHDTTLQLDLKSQPWPAVLRWILADTGPGHPTVGDGTVPPVADPGSGSAPLTIRVRSAQAPILRSQIEIYARDDPGSVVRSGQAMWTQGLVVHGLPVGDYRVLASHRDFLEQRLDLDDWDPSQGARELEISLPEGAAVRLQALDRDDRPVFGLELTIERLGEPPDVLSRDPGFADSKRLRVWRSDRSGWIEARGRYPGRYRLRPSFSGAREATQTIVLGLGGGELQSELEVELEDQPIEVEAWVSPLLAGE